MFQMKNKRGNSELTQVEAMQQSN